MEKYPIGLQHFKDIVTGGFVYVDKTSFIPLLLEKKYHFLSRPRRFGKSLLISTLESFFRGERELFHGLRVDSFDWEWESYPVIRIDLCGGTYTDNASMIRHLNFIVGRYEREFGLAGCVEDGGSSYGGGMMEGVSSRFQNLIYEACARFGKKVVVLVDEYDKPLLDAIDNAEVLAANRNTLSAFYSVLKSSEECLRFVFLTGVTRFGHLNIFSGLNNLQDISLDRRFSAICGFTKEELTRYFPEGISRIASTNDTTPEEALAMLAEYYDGYHFSADLVDIYNPYSLITAFDEGEVRDIWPLTGNSYFLLRQLRQHEFDLFDLEGITVDYETLIGLDPTFSDPVTLLYQSGYLTIKRPGPDQHQFILGLPNHEVTTALYKALIPYYTGNRQQLRPTDYSRIREWLATGNVVDFLWWLKEFFARVTYDVKLLPLSDRFRQESDFQFVVFSILSLACGLDKVCLEETTSNGRIDLAVETERFVYIFEFKIGGYAAEAIDQIRRKGYASRWAADRRQIILAGISFSPETRGVEDFAVENL